MTADPAAISVTAKLSAYYRKFSDIAFAAEVATLIGADDAFAEIVRNHGLDPDKLTFYAPMFEARYKSITQLIRTCGAYRFSSWRVATHFADSTSRETARNLPPERIRLREAITGITQRQLDASAFEDADDLAAFLGRLGFEAHVRSQIDETPSFSTIAALGLSPAVLDRLRSALRVWIVTAVGHSGQITI